MHFNSTPVLKIPLQQKSSKKDFLLENWPTQKIFGQTKAVEEIDEYSELINFNVIYITFNLILVK